VAALGRGDHTNGAIASEVERYLLTGETDPYHSAWGGDSFMDRAQRASDDLRGALVAEVSRRSAGAVVRDLPEPHALVALTRRKSEPMVRGLFPRVEQGTSSRWSSARSSTSRRKGSRASCATRASTTTPGTWRLELADAFGRQFRPGDERVDADEVADIVRDAAGRRDGWKVILGRCTPPADAR
jgi:hypothetical protein